MSYKLVCFDVDGTLVDNISNSWQIFHDHFKISSKRRDQARQDYFSGKISYREWAQHDVSLWKAKHMRRKDFLDAIVGLKLMTGALETVTLLKNSGFKMAIISGSLDIILETLLPSYKTIFNNIYISSIYFSKNGDISHVTSTEYDMDRKADALKEIAENQSIGLEECVFVGDESNDVKICQAAGLGIAFNSNSDRLTRVADIIIKVKDLREILKYIF